jgi:hypothetical protein
MSEANCLKLNACPPGQRLLTTLGVVWLMGGLSAGSLPAWGKDSAQVDYNRDVRPILAENCFLCHGHDPGTRQAGLRLDTEQGARAALESDASQHAIVPGEPAQSLALARVLSADASEQMPPPESNRHLTGEQKEILRRWIEQGAEYQSHWSLVTPQAAAIPQAANRDWGQNDIDAFVLQGMQTQGLQPNPRTDKEQLIRRVTFDLTGLPPTLEEIDNFLADERPQAYETVVDRLLNSPHFGERLAAEWLDVARYSDTYGFQVDRDRFVWPWRDWVIRSFNQDLPYDEFLTRQLAGDLLPHATQDDILATTFCRLHPQEAEGGSIPEEYRVGYVADRIQTVATAFLGMTLECARCHDHKYDPLTQKEYYQLFAFFDDIDEAGLYSYFTPSIPTPTLRLMNEQSQQRLNELQQTTKQAEQKLLALRESLMPEFEQWQADAPQFSHPLTGQIAHLDFEQVAAPNQSVRGQVGQGVQLTGDDGISTQVGNFHRWEPFSFSLWLNTPDVKERAVVLHRSRAWTDAGSRGYELLIDQGQLSFALVHFDPGNSLRIRTREQLPTTTWQHVAMTYDGSSRANGVRLYLNGQPVAVEVIRDQLTRDITGGGGDNIVIGERFRDHGFSNGQVDELRVFNRELSRLEVMSLHQPGTFHQVVGSLRNTRPEEVTPQNGMPEDVRQDCLREHFLLAECAVARQGRKELQQARQQESDLIEEIPEIMVMRDMPKPKQAYLLQRGEYNLRGEEVFPDTPASLPHFPDGAPRNRLGFARWLTSPEHPLTGRVAVNRYWQMIFGTGLVETTEDLGTQGQWPSHPELLDTLTRQWIDQGWSVKWLLKQMVLSETYCQSSRVSAEKERIDPSNRWLSHAAGSRMTAEMLRDNALAISGLLVDRIGGPPARPYEVEVAFKPLPRDQGDGLYRRSLYTFWSRTGPAPVMMALDAAKRDVCQVRRERTLSPLQPLVLLNGPQFVEAARFVSQRVLTGHPDDVRSQLIDLFRWTTSRHPQPRELEVLHRLYVQHLDEFTRHPEQAQALLHVGDKACDADVNPAQLAALTGVTNMLMNFDDAVFRR